MLTGFCDTSRDEKPSHPETGDWMSLHWVCTNTGFWTAVFAWKQPQPRYLGALYLGRKNLPPSDLGCMLCRSLTWVMAVTSLLLKSIDPIDHSFTNPLLLIPTVSSVFLSFTILPKFIFPYLYGLYCSCYSAVWSALLNDPSNWYVCAWVLFCLVLFLSNTLLFTDFSKRSQNSTSAYPWTNLVKQHLVSLDIYVLRDGCYWNKTNKYITSKSVSTIKSHINLWNIENPAGVCSREASFSNIYGLF